MITVSDGTDTDTDTVHLDGRQHQPGAGLHTDIADQTDAEGDTVSLDADATDADLDTLTYSATGLPDGVSIDELAPASSAAPCLASAAGIHSVVVTVSDGTDTDTDTFTWTVANTNQAPVFSTDIADQSDAEGDAVSLDADATDADLDTLTYSATGLPDGVSIDSGDRRHQRHLVIDFELRHPQRHDHRVRRHRHRHRHLHLDGDQRQPGAGLQHRHRRPVRRRGRRRVSSTPTRPMPISTR